MDSSDPKNSGKEKSGGLSASDLRARLGLKPSKSGAGSSASSLRARLGLEPLSKSAAPASSPLSEEEPAPPEQEKVDYSVRTSRIDESVLDILRKDEKDSPPPVLSPPEQEPVEEEEEEVHNSTHALSLDEFEDLLVSGDGEVVAPEPEADSVFGAESQESSGDLDSVVDALGAPPAVDDLGFDMSELEAEAAELEEEEEEGEKTQLLDTSAFLEEEEEFDAFPDEEKTQIMMSAMDYDPLTGRLILESGECPQKAYVLARDKTTLGRGTKNDVVIPDIAMSRRHLQIERYAEGFVLRDQDSGNGTYHNERRIVYAELRQGDIIEFGNVKFRFEQEGGDPEKLWKGVAKIEYHVKDTGGAPAPAPAPAPPAPSAAGQMSRNNPTPAGHLATGVIGPGGQQGFSHPMMNQVQQQPMRAQPWMGNMGYTGFPQAVQPGMLQQQQQRRGSPIVTALIVFFTILLLGLVGLIVWTLADRQPQQQENAKTEDNAEEKRKQAAQFVNEGLSFFEQRQWEAARSSFQTVVQLDPNNDIAKRYLNEFIPRDQATEASIVAAMNAIKESPSLEHYAEALIVLENVSPESIFADEVRNRHLPAVKSAYASQLKLEAKRAMVSERYVLARKHLDKIEKKLGIIDDPEIPQLRKRIAAKEGQTP